MKRILKNCLSLILVLTILAGPGYAGLNEVDFGGFFAVKAEAASVSDLTFEHAYGESYRVTDCTTSATGEITIPSTYNGLPVTSICDNAFRDCTSLTSVIIPDSVTSVGISAFNGCTSLTSITIPDSVTSIGDYAFSNTAYYNNSSNWDGGVLYIGNHLIKAKDTINGDYIIKDGTKTIAEAAFYRCSSLTSITIPDSVTSIGDYAFEYCTNLTSVTISNSVTSIGDYAFYECYSLTSVHITDIASWCSISFGDYYSNPLYCADNLYINRKLATDVVVPDGVTKIPAYSFSCDSLTSITIPNSITSIGDYAFYYCENLTSVTIPNSVKSIGGFAFVACSSLTSITIPNSVTSIGCFAFDGTAYYNDYSNWVDGALYIGNHLITGGGISGDYIIKDGTKTIAAAAFNGCSSLTSITIPNSVTSIGGGAFYSCDSLTSITIPDSVTSIGDDAFRNCANLTSITIPDSVTSIGDRAFYYCTSLTSVTIPNSVTSIGDSAFGYYSNEQNKVNGFTINGYKGSAAEKYANANGFTFFDLQAKPKLTKIENASNGIKITWGKATGAQSYNVYRKTYSNGKWSGWSTIKTGATGTTYTDKTAKSGTYYRYTVRAKNKAVLGSFDSTGLKIKFLATPKLSSVANGSGKVTVKWSKVTGASSYTVYRKTYSNGKWSGWSKIGTTKNTYYNDAKVSNSKNYKYTVRATSGDYSSYYNTSGLKIKYLAGPKISSASSRRDGILINWNKITGASGYYVYRKTSSGDWKKIATVKGNTKIKYLDETPRKGVTYQYRVKAYSGNYTSTYANTYKIKCKY